MIFTAKLLELKVLIYHLSTKYFGQHYVDSQQHGQNCRNM